MTRVNGVFEKDFGVHMNLISNTDLVIYTNASTDPYSDASVGADSANSTNAQGWGIQLQNTLTSVLGNAAYDIGHLFGATGGGGNAGCIGCVCTKIQLVTGSGTTIMDYAGITELQTYKHIVIRFFMQLVYSKSLII